MSIFEFLRLLQQALSTSLFVRVTDGMDARMIRYRVRNGAALRALFPSWFTRGLDGNDPSSEPTVQDYEFCPITLVAAWLGYGWSSVGAYDAAGSRMGLDHETRENIIQAADIKLPDEDYCHDEGDYNRRATLESACVPTPFIPEGWQFVD